MFKFSVNEIERLRTLAKKVAEIAMLPIQEQKVKLWTTHNDLKTTEPLVHISPENGWNECITNNILECKNKVARGWERYLLQEIYWFENLKDDKGIENYFDVPYIYTDTGWSVEVKKNRR